MIWAWIITTLVCFLVRGPLERFASFQSALFISFLGLLILGTGLIAIGAHYGMIAVLRGEFAQAMLNLIPMSIGAFCIWMVARPLMRLVTAWFNKRS